MPQYFLMKPREKKRILFRLNHIEGSIIEIHAFSKAISSEKEFLNSRSLKSHFLLVVVRLF